MDHVKLSKSRNNTTSVQSVESMTSSSSDEPDDNTIAPAAPVSLHTKLRSVGLSEEMIAEALCNIHEQRNGSHSVSVSTPHPRSHRSKSEASPHSDAYRPSSSTNTIPTARKKVAVDPKTSKSHSKSSKSTKTTKTTNESSSTRPHLVIKESYLLKESKTLKKARQRWMVLTGKCIKSYREMQQYSNPTECFDLTHYRTARVCKSSSSSSSRSISNHSTHSHNSSSNTGASSFCYRFELIESSLRQEKRVFVAESKQEMMDWIRCIKRVILYSKEFSTKCRTLRSCLSLRRLSYVLKLHFHFMSRDDSVMNMVQHCSSYKQLIKDYHHILNVHLNEDNVDGHCTNSNRSYEYIYKLLNVHCDVAYCPCFKRLHRIREHEERGDAASRWTAEQRVYRDLLDTIHCTLVHGFDSGLKVRHKVMQQITEQLEDDELTEQAHLHCFDHELLELKHHLSSKKKRLIRVRGEKRTQNGRFVLNTSC